METRLETAGLKDLLGFQLGRAFDQLDVIGEAVRDAEWQERPFPGGNTFGFDVWHATRTVDWVVNGVARGRPELVDDEPWADLKVADAMYGTGATKEAADRVPAKVTRKRVRDYTLAVRDDTLRWFETATLEELCAPADLRRAGKAEYLEGDVWEESQDLQGIPIWQLLARVVVAHCRLHYGEIMSQVQGLRARAAAGA